MNETTTELERQSEAARERVADTAETIRKKLTAGQLFDEFSNMFTGGDLAGAVGNLKAQVRDNPLPAVLVGAGLAWLAFGNGVGSQNGSGHHSGTVSPSGSPRPPHGHAGGTERSVVDTVTGAAGSVAAGAKNAAGSVSEAASEMVNSLSHTADRLRHSMLTGSSHTAPNMPKSLANLTSQEPLLVAAAGVAIGALIGAMLPPTGLEKEQVGSAARRLREQAGSMIDKGRESASRVATEAYRAVKDEADRQGLGTGDGSSLGERVGEVVRSAAEAADDTARHELGVDHEGTTQRS